VFRTETKGERGDVTATLLLNRTEAANIVFNLVLSCSTGQKVMVIAATQGNLLAPLEAPPCP